LADPTGLFAGLAAALVYDGGWLPCWDCCFAWVWLVDAFGVELD
jgi:hypothetical protein